MTVFLVWLGSKAPSDLTNVVSQIVNWLCIKYDLLQFQQFFAKMFIANFGVATTTYLKSI